MSLSELIRQQLEKKIASKRSASKRNDDSLFLCIKKITDASTPTDLASNHDHYLYD